MASNGEALAPWSTAKLHSHWTSSSLPATTPRVASLWPAMALVAECTTRSTPWSSGRCTSGVAKVESTTVIGPAMAPSSSRSTRSRRGLAGVSAMHQHRLARPDGLGERARVGAVDEGDVDAEPGARRLQQQLGAGVDLALGDDVVALRADAEDHRADGPHARGERPGALGALELGDGVLEALDRRVAVAGVEAVGPRRSWPSAGPRRPSGSRTWSWPTGSAPARCRCRPVRPGWPGSRGAGAPGRWPAPGSARSVGSGGSAGQAWRFSTSARKAAIGAPTWAASMRNPSWPSGLSITTYWHGVPCAARSSRRSCCRRGG